MNKHVTLNPVYFSRKNSCTMCLIGRHLIGRHAAVTAKDETEKVVPINFLRILTSLGDHSKEIWIRCRKSIIFWCYFCYCLRKVAVDLSEQADHFFTWGSCPPQISDDARSLRYALPPILPNRATQIRAKALRRANTAPRKDIEAR